MLKVIIISLLGKLVVFGFLLLIYFILFSFKYIFKQEEKNEEHEPLISNDNEAMPGEELASILTALSYHAGDDLREEEIIINDARGK